MPNQYKLTPEIAREYLQAVIDPELGISIVDLGLVYNISIIADGDIHIRMTLTSLGCPLFETIQSDIYSALKPLEVPKEKIYIELTFDPPWDKDKMSEEAKAMLGFI